MNYLGIDAKNVVKYQCVHCLEWVEVDNFKQHSLTHVKDTMLPSVSSLQEYIDRYVPLGLVALSDFQFKTDQ